MSVRLETAEDGFPLWHCLDCNNIWDDRSKPHHLPNCRQIGFIQGFRLPKALILDDLFAARPP